jgi:hypothetical protein
MQSPTPSVKTMGLLYFATLSPLHEFQLCHKFTSPTWSRIAKWFFFWVHNHEKIDRNACYKYDDIIWTNYGF